MNVRRRAGIAALILIAAILPLILPPAFRSSVALLAREGIAPYERIAARMRERLAGWKAGGRAFAVHKENEELRRRLDDASARMLLAESVERENRELRGLLDFSYSRRGLIAAEILSAGGSDAFGQRIRIGKGRRHGIGGNNPVFAPDGLVGVVMDATATTADVRLITDPNSRVACRFEPDIEQARGILTGGGRTTGDARMTLLHTAEPLELNYLEKSAEIAEGTLVVTSGLGGIYPEGVPVGRVAEVSTDSSGLYQRTAVLPAVNFATLRYVAVLVDAATEPGTSGGGGADD